MFTISIDSSSKVFFSAATMLIGIPTSVKVFNWALTLTGKKILYTELINSS
jgi:heme/copper-type cytochrome/quinol oxidase subunit 1